MPYLKKIVFFLCAYSGVFFAKSQTPNFISYSINDGLTSNEVYDIFQDSQRFIWFATDHGVVRFDGFKMQTLTIKDGLTDPVVFGFTEDEQQRIWFRTYSGNISYYDHGKIHPINWSKYLGDLAQNNLMYGLYSFKDTIYFSTEKSIVKIDPMGNVDVENFHTNHLTLKISKEMKLLVGLSVLSNKVKKLSINNKSFIIQLTDTLSHNKVISSLQYGNLSLLTINSDIFEYDGITLKKVFTGRASIISLSKDDEGFYWVGYSGNGVDKIDRTYKIVTSQFLSEYSITRVLQDHEGGFWFSTLEQGVFYTSNLETKSFDLDEKTRVVTFGSDHCYIGDQKGVVSKYELSTGNLIWKKIFEPPIRALFITSNNELWVSASTNRTYIVDLNTSHINRSIEGSYTSFSESDSAYWAVGKLRLSKFYPDGQSKYVQTNTIHLAIICKNEKLFISGRTGLEIYDQKFNLLAKPEILINSRIKTMTTINESEILIGTIGNGFQLINEKTLEISPFNIDQNSIFNDVYHAVQLDSLIWLATEKGLIAVERVSSYDNHFKIRNVISNESLNDRITSIHFTDTSIWAISDKKLKIIPLKTLTQKTQPIFYYDLINPISVSKTEKIILPHNAPLQIRFGFISFSNQNIYARYRIKEESNWIETQARVLNLLSIAPGKYNLDFQFSVDHNTWIAATAIPFQISPPWWSTWYFRITTALALALVGLLLYRGGIKQYRKRNEYLGLINEQQKKLLNAEIEATERERSRIAKELHDGIGTDLASIKFIAEQLNKKTETQEATTIQNQLQRAITDIRGIVYGLAPPGISKYGLSAGLQNYIAKLNEHGLIQIKFDFLGTEVTDTHLSTTIFRIIQELVSNSTRHAKSKNISIHINVFPDYLNIVYTDDGIGFDPALITPGLGLSNIQSRVDSLNGNLDFESGKNGTAYSIDIPLKK